MEYKNLNLKTIDAQRTITVNDNDIKVFTYLPILQKNDLVQIALQQATEMGMINEIKLEMYFNLFVVYMYTDLVFTDEEKENPAELYPYRHAWHSYPWRPLRLHRLLFHRYDHQYHLCLQIYENAL